MKLQRGVVEEGLVDVGAEEDGSLLGGVRGRVKDRFDGRLVVAVDGDVIDSRVGLDDSFDEVSCMSEGKHLSVIGSGLLREGDGDVLTGAGVIADDGISGSVGGGV